MTVVYEYHQTDQGMTSYSIPASDLSRTIMALRRGIFDTAHQFCEAFANNDQDTIFSHFSTKHQVSAIEYGEQALAPFLGRTFVGISQIKDCFELISSLLSVKHVKFSEYVVDAEAMKVSVKGRGTFTWLNTNQSWDETFTYMLDFDEDSKIVRYQVWADSGAAYLARIGKLDLVREKGELPTAKDDTHHLAFNVLRRMIMQLCRLRALEDA